ncbi:hypothetical protein M378DRAFT_172855 [Amanita muscaria Koide BX008]|uniref:F-box domain-containing protein n=1 Tax=Amanita muscaria (strain Koide BX008) TaxID=946122 RepID=A0A0C2W560_AMAMK|nr:hypothetical protein M378DRAFT_172855 [Amanita muscaria Koide BX008]
MLANALGIFSRKGESFPINLRSLCLTSLPRDFLPPLLEDAFVLLMAVHSLRDIRLMHCHANLVQNLPPLLKHLSFDDTSFSSLPTTRKELPKLESLTIGFFEVHMFPGDAVERIVNTTQLKTFQGTSCDADTMPVINRILRPTSNSLEHLTLSELYITDPDSISIELNHFLRLTDITFIQLCSVPYYLSEVPHAFIWMTKTMKNISHRNAIQNLTFHLELGRVIHILDFDWVMKEVWQELDRICSIPQLASSKSFRGITLSVRSTAANCDAFADLVQNRLPVTKRASKLHIKTSSFR